MILLLFSKFLLRTYLEFSEVLQCGFILDWSGENNPNLLRMYYFYILLFCLQWFWMAEFCETMCKIKCASTSKFLPLINNKNCRQIKSIIQAKQNVKKISALLAKHAYMKWRNCLLIFLILAQVQTNAKLEKWFIIPEDGVHPSVHT